MYTTCLFCHSSLGTNETIESFPVGRRLAFDAAHGRLWVVTLDGDDALRAASSILPAINAATDGLYRGISRNARPFGGPPGSTGAEIFLDRIPATVALALEMASHEDVERRSMEGELALLERAWREAEEIASISDSLLLREPQPAVRDHA